MIWEQMILLISNVVQTKMYICDYESEECADFSKQKKIIQYLDYLYLDRLDALLFLGYSALDDSIRLCMKGYQRKQNVRIRSLPTSEKSWKMRLKHMELLRKELLNRLTSLLQIIMNCGKKRLKLKRPNVCWN